MICIEWKDKMTNPLIKGIPARNLMFLGDNRELLNHLDETVDCVYADPPYNSGQDYNIVFYNEDGKRSPAQVKAFDDMWGKKRAPAMHKAIIRLSKNEKLKVFLGLQEKLLKPSNFAYVVFMLEVIVGCHKALKSTGSMYLHCDTTMVPYLRMAMDVVFGACRFRNQIVWQRSKSHNDAKKFGRCYDTILYYTKSKGGYVWNPPMIPYTPEYIRKKFKYRDDDGRHFHPKPMTAESLKGGGYSYEWPPGSGTVRLWRCPIATMQQRKKDNLLYMPPTGKIVYGKVYLDESKGKPITNWWDSNDIPPATKGEAQKAYNTQKPERLIQRIIEASTNKSDVVLDPFGGGGTTAIAAERLGRRWVLADIAMSSYLRTIDRLYHTFPEKVETFRSVSEIAHLSYPTTYESFKVALKTVPHKGKWVETFFLMRHPDFEWVGHLNKGPDGIAEYTDVNLTHKVWAECKAKKLALSEFNHTVKQAIDQDVAHVVFMLTEPPPESCYAGARKEGERHINGFFGNKSYPVVQFITVEEIFKGQTLNLPTLTKRSVYASHPAGKPSKAVTILDKYQPNAFTDMGLMDRVLVSLPSGKVTQHE